MTGNLLLDLVISLAGVALLVFVAFLLGATRTLTLDRATAEERLAFDEPDFRPGDWLVGRDGRAAIALSESGAETAVVFVNGDGLGVRRFPTGRLRIERGGDSVVVLLGDISRGKVAVAAADAAEAEAWAGRLAAATLTSAHGIS